ncbi:MAG: hypothetical protein R2697_18330 [Ilumatobacteraceae bacterium]
MKLIGDEVMFVDPDPNSAVEAGRALIDTFSSMDDGVLPRGGMAFGSVVLRGGDYYGSVVNIASRLADAAVPGELLVTTGLADATHCSFEPAGRRMLRASTPRSSSVRSRTEAPGPPRRSVRLAPCGDRLARSPDALLRGSRGRGRLRTRHRRGRRGRGDRLRHPLRPTAVPHRPGRGRRVALRRHRRQRLAHVRHVHAPVRRQLHEGHGEHGIARYGGTALARPGAPGRPPDGDVRDRVDSIVGVEARP